MDKIIPIIIVTYNQVEKFTIPCLESIIENTHVSYKIIIFDNASSDNTVALLTEKYRSYSNVMDIIPYNKNIGWNGGNLKALEYISKKYEYDFFCLLNSDTIVSNNWLGKLKSSLINYENSVTITPTEYIYENNILKTLYTKISEKKITTIILKYSPLKILKGKGLSLPKSQKPITDYDQRVKIVDVNSLNGKLERRYRTKVELLKDHGSGYCILVKSGFQKYIEQYLINFNHLLKNGRKFWNDIKNKEGVDYLLSKGTYVYHYRGGSGGYWPYKL